MSRTYIVTGRDTGIPSLPNDSVLAGLNVGDTFTTTLSGPVEAELIAAGLIAKYPAPMALTAAAPSATRQALMAHLDGTLAWDGVPRVVACPFAFDSPGLATGSPSPTPGFEVFQPAIGDLLFDAWFSIETAWDGTTPKGDAGQFIAGGENGWWNQAEYSVDLTIADGSPISLGLLSGTGGPSSTTHVASMTSLLALSTVTAAGGFQAHPNHDWVQPRYLPAPFLLDDPVRVLVTDDGTINGHDPGSAQGAATLYLLIATPASA